MPKRLTQHWFRKMAWCHQATIRYLSLCWPKSLMPYDVTRPQWLNTVRCRYNAVNFLPNPHKIHLITRPLGRDMGCNLWFDTGLYSVSVNAVLYEISCYFRPCYNGTLLYKVGDIFVHVSLYQICKMSWKNAVVKITSTSLKGQWVSCCFCDIAGRVGDEGEARVNELERDTEAREHARRSRRVLILGCRQPAAGRRLETLLVRDRLCWTATTLWAQYYAEGKLWVQYYAEGKWGGTNIASDNGLSPVHRQAIIWTNNTILRGKDTGHFLYILSKLGPLP